MFLAHPKLCNEIHTCYVITSTLKWGEIDCGCILAYFSQFLLLDVGLFFWQQDSWEKWEELPQVEISVLLLLTLKGAEEPALWHEISDFSKRDRPRWYYWKKKKIPETHPSWVSEPRNYSYHSAALARDQIPGIKASEAFHCCSNSNRHRW